MTDLNVTETEVQDIANPMRSNPGGGAAIDQGGVMRSQPGSGVEEMGSGNRQVVDPDHKEEPQDGQDAAGTGEGTEGGTPTPEPKVDDKGASQEGGQEAAADPTLTPELQAKLTPFTEEVQTSGTLSPESIAKAATEFGVSESMVKAYLAGVTAEAAPQPLSAEGQATVSAAYELTGGEEHFGTFRESLTDAQRADIKAAADTNNPAVLKAVMGPLVQSWKEAGNGAPRRDITSEGAGNGSTAAEAIVGYETREAQLAGARDKRYGKDAKYTAEHDQKVISATWAR